MPLLDLLKLPDLQSAIKCDPCSVQRRRLAELQARPENQGKPLTVADVVAQIGWHPDHVVPPCPPAGHVPSQDTFKTTTPPCVTERSEHFKEMKKERIAQAIAPATNEETPPPTTDDFPVRLFGVCRRPGTCHPSDTWSNTVADSLSYTVLWNALSGGMHLGWVRENDPNRPAIITAFIQKWLSTGQNP